MVRTEVKGVQSVEKCLQLLEALGDAGTPLTLTELCRRAGLNISTSYRILQTLLAREFVQLDEDTGGYRLGLKTFQLGNAALYSLDLRAAAHPILEELVMQCQETANVVILEGPDVVCIDQVPSPHMVKMMVRVGARLPAACTGGGKLLLANLAQGALERWLQRYPLRRYTPNTIVDAQRFKAHLSTIRQRGSSADWEECETGVCCVAAPVRNHLGRVIAALTVSGPSNRMTEDFVEHLRPHVTEYALRLSARLGYELSSPATPRLPLHHHRSGPSAGR